MMHLPLALAALFSAQVPLSTFPMSAALSRDSKYLVVMNAGVEAPSLSVIDVATTREIQREPVADAWLGLAFSPNGRLLYVGGGSRASVFEFTFSPAGKLAPSRTFEVTPEAKRTHRDFIGDVALSPDGRLIYAARLFQNQVAVINPQSGRVIEQFSTPRRPYRILFHPDGKSFFVSSWADGVVSHHEASNGNRLGGWRAGAHATDMLWLDKEVATGQNARPEWKARLFVTASNTNSVYVFGATESKDLSLIESINLAMTPYQPLGMTPSALALSPDQNRLYVVCSDANAVAVVDVSQERSRLLGFLPAGAYPTAVRALPDRRLVVVNGGGSAGFIDPFDDEQLGVYTRAVLSSFPYRDELLVEIPGPEGSPVPRRIGDPSPIQHVVYILSEKGEANAERQTRATAAIVPDYVKKLWPGTQGGRRRHYDYEAGDPASLPPAGYIWTNVLAAGLTMRNYGYAVINIPNAPAGAEQISGVHDPALATVTDRFYRGSDPAYPDAERAKVFLRDLARFESEGYLPRFLILRLGGDDQALERIVEGLSHSKFWPTMAIFISPSRVISPFARRAASANPTSDPLPMLRTMELMLGLRPMTWLDAAAPPLWTAFQRNPNTP